MSDEDLFGSHSQLDWEPRAESRAVDRAGFLIGVRNDGLSGENASLKERPAGLRRIMHTPQLSVLGRLRVVVSGRWYGSEQFFDIPNVIR